ncbi:MAG: sulfite exporter TauE/SafE family protein [Moorea sp. SIO2B7]|nr:sulfite exporter TauE/SafE family protein [Moorena sp. SIO2B7]
MIPENWFIFALGGLFAGFLAGLLGIGGGTVLVPILVALGYQPVQAVATSSLAIVITSFSGSLQNWRMGYLDFQRVIYIALPSLITAQIGVYFADTVSDYILLSAFAMLLIGTIFLTNLRKRLAFREDNPKKQTINPLIARIGTGSAAGLLAGFFGVGGGVIMVPLQMLLLGENIKVAIQTSLGVIVITSISACVGHAHRGNVLFLEGIMLGIGGLVGAQLSTRYLPKLPDKFVSFSFRMMLAILSVYFFWRAWNSYQG